MSVIDKIKGFGGLASEVARLTLEPILYNIGISGYAAGVKCAALRNPKAQKMIAGHREIFRTLREKIDSYHQPVIWVHAASLGEFEQGRPIMEEIRRRRPEAKILLTFFSPSGYEVRHDWPGADVVVYLPFDTPHNVNRFLDIVRPSMAIFVKYEFWRNYLHKLSARNIPTYLVSAVFRPEQVFFKSHGAWYRDWLRLYTHIYVQDERSRELLEGIGIKNVSVAGDTRFDRVSAIRSSARPIPALEVLKRRSDRPVFIAGSSWPGDEEIYAPWVNRSDLITVIAPHEFDARRLDILRSRFPDALLYTEVEQSPELAGNARTLIMNCFGLLSSAYRYADIAYVGGGFGDGIHNINEAAVYGIPVIYGPNNGKFIEARELAEAGGGFPVNTKEEFESVADNLLDLQRRQNAGSAAGVYIQSKLGATDKICADLFPRKTDLIL